MEEIEWDVKIKRSNNGFFISYPVDLVDGGTSPVYETFQYKGEDHFNYGGEDVQHVIDMLYSILDKLDVYWSKRARHNVVIKDECGYDHPDYEQWLKEKEDE